MSFSIEHQSKDADDKYLLSVRNARLGGEESEGPCDVRVIEGNNTYVGGCSSEEPSSERPCQISLREKAGVITGELYCRQIPNNVSLAQIRYLVAPRTEDEPAELELYGCRGL